MDKICLIYFFQILHDVKYYFAWKLFGDSLNIYYNLNILRFLSQSFIDIFVGHWVKYKRHNQCLSNFMYSDDNEVHLYKRNYVTVCYACC